MDIAAGFFELAPRSFRSHRPLRYDGGGFGVETGSLAPADRQLALGIYTRVKGFYELWFARRSSPDWPALRQALLEFDTPGFLDTIQRLGPATTQGSGATPAAPQDFPRSAGGQHGPRGGWSPTPWPRTNGAGSPTRPAWRWAGSSTASSPGAATASV